MKPKKLLAVILLLALLSSTAGAVNAAARLPGFPLVHPWTDGVFTDVSEDDWFFGGVLGAYTAGLMIGRGDGVFDPDGWVTRAEVLTAASRVHAAAAGSADPGLKADAAESGAQSSSWRWWSPYARYAEENGLWDGTGEIENPIGRGAAAAILANALGEEMWLSPINIVAEDAIPDVPSDGSPLSAGIYRLYRAGVFTGMDGTGAFYPDAGLRRCELAAILTRLISPDARRTVTGLTHPADAAEPMTEEEARAILREALTAAYENRYGPFVPLDLDDPDAPDSPDSPDASGEWLPDSEYLRRVIPRLALAEENENFYVFSVIFPFWVEKRTGTV
ncbi:MAG: S-layer homology domain-containing protein, partial [Clostridia bacterium]|nr:S-layer homology domain-containing protein [Clostridia bacterium]